MALQNVKTLVSYLEGNRQNSTISLAYASISDDGVAEVAKFVRDNPFVKHLDIRGNSIQTKGISALANGIKINRSLRSLNLKWNAIGRDPSGVSALCDALKSNLTITNVDLRNNRINNIGAKHISELLKTNTTITHLNVSWNDLGVDGGVALLEGLKRNNTLIEFDLSGSKVGEDILSEVVYLLRRNRTTASFKATPKDVPSQPPEAGDIKSRDISTPTGASFRSGRTKKDDSSLMLRLLRKEREQALPEDRLLYQQITEHIEKLLLESTQHKQGRCDAEDREKLATSGASDREQRYLRDIQICEESLIQCLEDKETLQTDVAKLSLELKGLREEKAIAVKQYIVSKERAAVEEQQLQIDKQALIQTKFELQDKLALGNQDLQLLIEENDRLRIHVAQFEKDANEILNG